ncbi:MAG: hypothetical protein MI724_09025 [Spirochaetales bacterium]|nr:hypothetical protein [Spirochaetales bacterium]
MKIDPIVVNVDGRYQTDRTLIDAIRNTGFLYEPKYGKGTAGFKASDIWIGEEYFEFIRITRHDGGGWRPDWTERYHRGHQGAICIFFAVDDIGCMRVLFPAVDVGAQEVRARVNDTQSLVLVRSADHFVHVRCRATRPELAGTRIEIENVRITTAEVDM